MRREGKTTCECAHAFGVSKQRISQVVQLMETRYGMDVNATDSLPYWSIREVGHMLHCNMFAVRRHIKNAGLVANVDYVARCGHKNGTRVYYSGIRKLEEHVSKTCIVCNEKFTCHAANVKVCNKPECRSRRSYSHRIPDVLRGPALEIHTACVATPVDERDWTRLHQSVIGTGLSMMQVRWLVTCGALPTMPDPTKSWRGDPVSLVSRTHIKIAADIYRKYGRIK